MTYVVEIQDELELSPRIVGHTETLTDALGLMPKAYRDMEYWINIQQGERMSRHILGSTFVVSLTTI